MSALGAMRDKWVDRAVTEGHTPECALEMWHAAECSCEAL